MLHGFIQTCRKIQYSIVLIREVGNVYQWHIFTSSVIASRLKRRMETKNFYSKISHKCVILGKKNKNGPRYVTMFMSELIATAILMFLGCMGCVPEVDNPPAVHHMTSLSFGLVVLLIIQVPLLLIRLNVSFPFTTPHRKSENIFDHEMVTIFISVKFPLRNEHPILSDYY